MIQQTLSIHSLVMWNTNMWIAMENIMRHYATCCCKEPTCITVEDFEERGSLDIPGCIYDGIPYNLLKPNYDSRRTMISPLRTMLLTPQTP